MNTGIIEKEETLIIETPERVPLEFALASIGNRFLAVLVDHFIQFFSLFVLGLVIYWITADNGVDIGPPSDEEPLSNWVVALWIVVSAFLFSGYFVFFEWLFNGQTPGKRLFKLRVIRQDGRPITVWEAISRNILRIIDSFPGMVIPIYSIGLISVFLSNRDQRIGDLFSGTVVVRETIENAPSFSETFGSNVGDSALRRVCQGTEFEADISSVTNEEIEVVEMFLRRRWDLKDRQRIWMAWRVALPIMFKIKPAYKVEGFSYEGFLEELLHRHRLRSSRF
ncbi:MAG: RDD family protein [Pyrinomonadaceae bacterium]